MFKTLINIDLYGTAIIMIIIILLYVIEESSKRYIIEMIRKIIIGILWAHQICILSYLLGHKLWLNNMFESIYNAFIFSTGASVCIIISIRFAYYYMFEKTIIK